MAAACCRFLIGGNSSTSRTKRASELTPQQLREKQQMAEVDDPNVPTDGTPYVMKTAKRVLPNKEDVKEYYDIHEEIASGAYSRIRRGFKKGTEEEVALKFISKDTTTEEERETILDEVQIMRAIRSPHTVKFIDFFESETHWVIVMEMSSGGELFERLKDLPNKIMQEDDARSIIKAVLETISLIHRHGILWRDAKPENILLSSPDSWEGVKLVDFGFAKRLTPAQRMDAFVGTPEYAAPEVVALLDVNRKGKSSLPIEGRPGTISRLAGGGVYGVTFDDDPESDELVEPRQVELIDHTYEARELNPPDLKGLSVGDRVYAFKWPSYSTKSDIWSIGVVLYVMLCGYAPFIGDNHRQLFTRIKQGKVEFSDESWTDKSKSVKRFIRSALTVNPSQRPTAKQLLAHPWITGEELPVTPVPDRHSATEPGSP